MSNLRKQWNDACLSAGINSLSTDTSARIMAVLLAWGGDNEAFTHNVKLMADCEYIKRQQAIGGALVVNKEFADKLRLYTKDLEKHEMQDKKPQWAIDLFKDMYNIKL